MEKGIQSLAKVKGSGKKVGGRLEINTDFDDPFTQIPKNNNQ